MSLQSGTNPKGIYVTMDAEIPGKGRLQHHSAILLHSPRSAFFDQNNGFCMGDPVGGEYEIYTTSDGGNSWIKVAAENIPNPLTSEEGITGYYSSIGDNAWFGTTKGRVYRSNDRGRHWDVSSTSFNGNTVDVDFADQFHGLAQNKSNKTTGTLSETFDGGVTWSLVKTTGLWVQKIYVLYQELKTPGQVPEIRILGFFIVVMVVIRGFRLWEMKTNR
jgi:photosystem II stability/assembly factor-like uncharacterized protein